MKGVRGSSPWGCGRCGCSATRHITPVGCRNVGCECPRAVTKCSGCEGWQSAYAAGSLCRDCYRADAAQLRKERETEWLLNAPKRELERQRRAKNRGKRTLVELRKLLLAPELLTEASERERTSPTS